MDHHYNTCMAGARGGDVTLYQCGCGLLHLRVQRVTLSLRPEEFRQLALIVSEALIRLGTQEAVGDAASVM